MKTKEEILSGAREVKRNIAYIYALIKNGKIVYIGQTTCLAHRIGTHMVEKDFDSWSIVECLGEWCSSDELSSIEMSYIKKFKPKYNKTYNKTGKRKIN